MASIEDLVGVPAPVGQSALSDRGRDFDVAIREMLKFAHQRNALDPIGWPDVRGAFPSHPFGGGATGQIPPVVVDANVLRNDIARACRDGRRLTLVNAANAGAIRMFCATHVIREVANHAERWAIESGVHPDDFTARWLREYVPLLRQIRPEDLPAGILMASEEARLADLALVDPDDLPTATLAMALGAFYLSEDRRALAAAYGDSLDLEVHHKWLEVLMASGDAGELGKVMFGAVAASRVAGYGMSTFFRWLSEKLPPIALLGIAGAILILGSRIRRDRWSAMGSGLAAAGEALLHLCAAYVEAYSRLRAASVPIPPTGELAAQVGDRAALARACLGTLARHPQGQMTAAQLAAVLNGVPVPHGEKLVRQTLRGSSCFRNTYHGHWQLGHPAWVQATRVELGPSTE